jgi:hypothetical protein
MSMFSDRLALVLVELLEAIKTNGLVIESAEGIKTVKVAAPKQDPEIAPGPDQTQRSSW